MLNTSHREASVTLYTCIPPIVPFAGHVLRTYNVSNCCSDESFEFNQSIDQESEGATKLVLPFLSTDLGTSRFKHSLAIWAKRTGAPSS
jgi:hypothetical protein